MVYFLKDQSPTLPLASPKTHVPLLPVKERGLRFYSPEVGRWTSRDPIGERGGGDLYVYLNGAPTDLIDPIGLQAAGPTCCCCCAESLSIDNVQEIVEKKYTDMPTVVAIDKSCKGLPQHHDKPIDGNYFELKIGLSYVASTRPADCELRWSEFRWADKSTSYDLLPTAASWQAAVWNNCRKKPCPGSESLTIPDMPGIWSGDAPTDFKEYTTLKGRITVYSASTCHCAHDSLEVRFIQRVTLDGSGKHADPSKSCFAYQNGAGSWIKVPSDCSAIGDGDLHVP